MSFVAQTADWMPAHMYETIRAGYEHKGFSFIHVIQRCPVFQGPLANTLTSQRESLVYVEHENGIGVSEDVAKVFGSRITHDPTDLSAARDLVMDEENTYLGLFYQNKKAPRYNDWGASNLGFTIEEKVKGLNHELDKYAI